MVNGSGRKLVRARRRAAAPLIFYIRADSPMQHLRDDRASTPPVLPARGTYWPVQKYSVS
jgi:hypothetical protein